MTKIKAPTADTVGVLFCKRVLNARARKFRKELKVADRNRKFLAGTRGYSVFQQKYNLTVERKAATFVS